MEERGSGIRIIPGTKDFLMIAPHGPFIDGAYQNDIRTGVIAETIQSQMGCSAIINDRYFKPKGPAKKSTANYILDLFRIDHAGKVPEYLEAIRSIAWGKEKTIVIFIHGIADDVADQNGQAHMRAGLFNQGPKQLHALIGFGQGPDTKQKDPEDRFSATHHTVTQLKDHLTRYGMTTLLTQRENPLFRGRDSKRLNQWFVQSGLGFDRVESIQLEIREKNFRDSDENAIRTARIIQKALDQMKQTNNI